MAVMCEAGPLGLTTATGAAATFAWMSVLGRRLCQLGRLPRGLATRVDYRSNGRAIPGRYRVATVLGASAAVRDACRWKIETSSF